MSWSPARISRSSDECGAWPSWFKHIAPKSNRTFASSPKTSWMRTPAISDSTLSWRCCLLQIAALLVSPTRRESWPRFGIRAGSRNSMHSCKLRSSVELGCWAERSSGSTPSTLPPGWADGPSWLPAINWGCATQSEKESNRCSLFFQLSFRLWWVRFRLDLRNLASLTGSSAKQVRVPLLEALFCCFSLAALLPTLVAFTAIQSRSKSQSKSQDK
mmetsp:Transcript_28732/g.62535  ORF Transcript_28732/g.62535 Transcript_28732/m.62535 type:complete len:216 (+) Transcript_28732:1361-2008(+)